MILGTYNDSIIILDSKNFNMIFSLNLNEFSKEESLIPHSIVISTFSERNCLFVGLRNGNLIIFDFLLKSGLSKLMFF